MELTLALHHVFDTPRDRLIWDVGHQAYAHKLITGRRDRFHTLRKKDGISGFPKRKESPYDVFDAGHSSTSLSAAAGIAEARCFSGEKYKVIAVIGDGSMTAGMAYEAMNWAGDRKKDLIIVLNDNEMSISPNVGAMSAYLNRVMTGKEMTRLKAGVLQFLKTLPGGDHMIKFTRQAEESLKAFLVPGMLFEELGFQYIGPLEGHRLDYLIRTFRNVRRLNRPVLVHVVTKKGKGCSFAEEEAVPLSRVGPFDGKTGALPSRKAHRPPTRRSSGKPDPPRLGKPQGRRHHGAMCTGTGLDEFATRFPERFFDVGIAEQSAVTSAAGLAVEGLVPVVAVYSTFLQRGFDRSSTMYASRTCTGLRLDRAGFVGRTAPPITGCSIFLSAVPSQHGRHGTEGQNEFRRMIRRPRHVPDPSPSGTPGGPSRRSSDDGPAEIPLGRRMPHGGRRPGHLRRRDDRAGRPGGRGRAPGGGRRGRRPVNCRFVKPLDRELLCATARKTGGLLTVEKTSLWGGSGSAVLNVSRRKPPRNPGETVSASATRRRTGDPEGTAASSRDRRGRDSPGGRGPSPAAGLLRRVFVFSMASGRKAGQADGGRGLAESRERARALILAGSVRVDGNPPGKAGTFIPEDAVIEVRTPDHPYVSRGA